MSLILGALFALVVIAIGTTDGESLDSIKHYHVFLDDTLHDRIFTLNSHEARFNITSASPLFRKQYHVLLEVILISERCKESHAHLIINEKTHPLDGKNEIVVEDYAISIAPSSNFKNCTVQFLSSLFLDVSENKTCPQTFTECKLKDNVDGENRKTKMHCVHNSLVGNGRKNCGPNYTNEDEEHKEDELCEPTYERVYDRQYLLTILLAGLFFIMCPVMIVIVMFYHRRIQSAKRNAGACHSCHRQAQIRPYCRCSAPTPTYDDQIKVPLPTSATVANNNNA